MPHICIPFTRNSIYIRLPNVRIAHALAHAHTDNTTNEICLPCAVCTAACHDRMYIFQAFNAAFCLFVRVAGEKRKENTMSYRHRCCRCCRRTTAIHATCDTHKHEIRIACTYAHRTPQMCRKLRLQWMETMYNTFRVKRKRKSIDCIWRVYVCVWVRACLCALA